MSEVVVTFDPAVTDAAGRSYSVRICGRVADGGRWDGWIEFEPLDGGATLRTPRETEQPDRATLEFWASGLTLSYLEGALKRARTHRIGDPPPGPQLSRPAFEGPAPRPPRSAATSAPPRAVLDPFEVFTQGEEVLRQQLSALDEGHLINIIRAYALSADGRTDFSGLRRAELARMIIDAVRARFA